jgi:hypothetical protein
MGAVYRPKDLPSGRRRIIERAVRDLSPDVKNDIIKILDSWERTGSTGSEEKLRNLLGQEEASRLFKKIRASKSGITYSEQEKLQDIFKESLTFD